jgi:hypothetical protein
LPKVIGPLSSDVWEQEVRRRMIEQLPSDWIVICNVSWASRNQSNYVRDGQADFVVLAPNFGMLIAEVKGSREVRVASDGFWYRRPYLRGGEPAAEVKLSESPPDQATRNMHELARLVAESLALQVFPGAYGFVVIYPNGEINVQSKLLDQSTIITKRGMYELHTRIKKCLKDRGGGQAGKSFDSATCEKVATILAKIGFQVLSVDTEYEISEDEETIARLTSQQYAALRGVFDFPRVAVIGPAGAGKTLLAIWRLKALISEAQRAVYVCFNKSLAEFLRKKNPDVAHAICNVDQLLFQLVKPKKNSTFPDNYFTETLPNEAADYAIALDDSQKYQAIVIDEGQDFGEYRLFALYQLLRPEESKWLFFADWTQDVYQKRFEIPLGAEVVFRLYHNCRNTKLVNMATNHFCEMNVLSMPESPVGEKPIIEFCKTDEIMAARAFQLISEFNGGSGGVILSPYRLENSCVSKVSRAYGLVISQDISSIGVAGTVVFSSIRGFKGLEAPIVVLVDISCEGSANDIGLEELYVGCTRARARLVLLTTKASTFARLTKKI